MKKTSDITLLLVSFLINIVVSFVLGFKYKASLSTYLSEPIYYQVVVFVSLSLPAVIKKIDSMQHRWRFNRSLRQLQENAHQIDVQKIGEEEKAMLEEMTNKDIHTASKIRDLYEEMQNQSNR